MALARALAIEPRVLLLDEPFGALDAKVRAELRAWLRRLHDEVHVTTVLVTHDQEEAMDVADRIVVLNEGRIEQVGTPRELYERPANGFVMGFLGPGRPPRRGARAPARPARRPPSRATARSRRWSTASCTSASRSAPSSSSPTARRSRSQLTRDDAVGARARARRHRVGRAHGGAGRDGGGVALAASRGADSVIEWKRPSPRRRAARARSGYGDDSRCPVSARAPVHRPRLDRRDSFPR